MERRTPLRRTTTLERRTPIRPVSTKRKAIQNDRALLVAEYLATRDCEVRWDLHCAIRPTDAHEPLTRARGGSILDPTNLVAACRWCHDQIHRHPAEATTRGYLIHSWATPDQIEAARQLRRRRVAEYTFI